MSTPSSVPPGAERRLRRDASRNRERIVATARRALDDGRALQFNEIARAADTGIGTVYRHFPTPEALREAAVLGNLEALLEAAVALGERPAWEALVAFVRHAVIAQRDDPALATVVAQPKDALARTGELRAELAVRFERLVGASAADGDLRHDLTTADVTALICGTAYAVRVDRAVSGRDSTDRYLDVLLAGIRSVAPGPRVPHA